MVNKLVTNYYGFSKAIERTAPGLLSDRPPPTPNLVALFYYSHNQMTKMEVQIVEQVRKHFPASTEETIVVGSNCALNAIAFLDCLLQSSVHTNRLGIRAVSFQDSCFDTKGSSEISSLFHTLIRVARHGALDGISVSGRIVDDFSSNEFFRLFASALGSFRAVNLSNVFLPQGYYGYLLGALTTSPYVIAVNIENVNILASDEVRAEIKTSSGSVGVLNGPAFLHEVSTRLSRYIPVDVWNSGWVFQEAQRMVMYVVQNSFLRTVPANVGVNLFVCACAFIIGRSDWSNFEAVLCESVLRCQCIEDPCTNLIMGVVQTEAGFLPGPVQSTFGASTVPRAYSDFHTYTTQPSVMKLIDPRPASEIRTWVDVASLPFLFANLVRSKSVTGTNVDELLTWGLDIA